MDQNKKAQAMRNGKLDLHDYEKIFWIIVDILWGRSSGIFLGQWKLHWASAFWESFARIASAIKV